MIGKKNRGSAVIELSLMIQVFLGCIYFYIMLFLFFVQCGNCMDELADRLYMQEREEEASLGNVSVRKERGMKVFKVDDTFYHFQINMELRRDESNPVENIRRWQLVTGRL